MKKLLIVLALLLPLSVGAISVPWNKNVAGKIFPPLVTDFVGIGTTTPQNRLSVASGTVAFQDINFATTTIGSYSSFFRFEEINLGGFLRGPLIRGASALGNILSVADSMYVLNDTVTDPLIGFLEKNTLNSISMTYSTGNDRLDFTNGSGGYTFDNNIGIGVSADPTTQIEIGDGTGITWDSNLGTSWNAANASGGLQFRSLVGAGSSFLIGSSDLGNYSVYDPGTGVWDFQGGANATNTSDAGWDLSGGCYAINGVCNGDGDITGDGTAGQVTYWNGPKSIYRSSSNDFTYSDTYAQLGVGTSTWADPTVRLALDAGSNSNQVQLYVNSTGLADQFSFNRGGQVSYVGPSAANNWDFYTTEVIPIIFSLGSSQQLKIDTTGNVGIGATGTPGTSLSIGNTGDNTINISETATSTFGSGINIRTGCFSIAGVCVGSGSGVTGGTAGMLTAWTSATALTATSGPTAAYYYATGTAATSTFLGGLVVDTNTLAVDYSSSKVMIGSITKNDGKLTVVAGTSGATADASTDDLVIHDDSNAGINLLTPNTNLSCLSFGDPQNSIIGQDCYNHSTNARTFKVNNSEAMRIDSSLRLGIGTTSPFALLSVQGFSANTTPIFAVATSTGNSVFQIMGNGHRKYTGPTPTITSCGGSPTITGNDNIGTIVGGTGSPTDCFVKWASPYDTENVICSPAWLVNPDGAFMTYVASSTGAKFHVASGEFTTDSTFTYDCKNH